MPKKIIGVWGDSAAKPYQFLFRTLSQLYSLAFHSVVDGEFAGLDGLLVLDRDTEAGKRAAEEGIPSYIVMGRGCPSGAAVECEVEFGNSPSLDPYLRTQTMLEREGVRLSPLAVQVGDEVLATQNGGPVWLLRSSQGAACQMVSVSPPALRESEFLFQYLNGRRFLGLLPLLNFLRQLVVNVDWEAPAPRACFVFDDPSLYWPSYGFLNYRFLSEHARKHGYFVSIATVPLDTWLINDEVAETIRSCNPRLSLVIHGNNHLPNELLRPDDLGGHLTAAAQALRRMERLKRAHGLPFLKIMEAPHGALAEDMFGALLSLGYEAALCTTELLVLHNPNARWPTTVGMERSEILGGGLPVIPRIKISRDWKNDVILKAFLRQPIIVAGHHTDAAQGMELLSELARVIRGLEGVEWSDLHGVLRTNYLQLREGDVLRVKMYSRRVRVPIPHGIRHLCVERPWIGSGCRENLTITTGHVTRRCYDAGMTVNDLALGNASAVEVSSELRNPISVSSVPPPAFNPWPISRKLLMEVRDRLAPVFPVADRFRHLTSFH